MTVNHTVRYVLALLMISAVGGAASAQTAPSAPVELRRYGLPTPPAPGAPPLRGDEIPTFKQYWLNGIKQSIQATGAQWEALRPKVIALIALMQNDPGNDLPQASARDGRQDLFYEPPSPLETAMEALRAVLNRDDADADEIAARVAAVRAARADLAAAIAKAQQNLAAAATERQQAILSAIGFLE